MYPEMGDVHATMTRYTRTTGQASTVDAWGLLRSLLILCISCLVVVSMASRADDDAQAPLVTIQLQVGETTLNTELAVSGEQRFMGLSFRKQLDENAGMLFVYEQEKPLTFTMRNTLLPLSIAFISSELVINEIHDMSVGPGQLFDSKAPARYALEVNQGWFARHGIKAGDRIVLP